MFNLIMRTFEWESSAAKMSLSSMFEYTDDHIANQFRENGSPILDRLIRLPCLFMPEGTEDQTCRVGQVTNLRIANAEICFEFILDTKVPTLTNRFIYEKRSYLDMIKSYEFSRHHWAVKEIDLYKFLLQNTRSPRQRPSVFQIPEHESIAPEIASAMMPFDASFNSVYESILLAAKNVGLTCKRADDIWESHAVIQDVVSLIDRSRVVICDCTGRNPNVFYEAGIAHALGREVILITQSEHDT